MLIAERSVYQIPLKYRYPSMFYSSVSASGEAWDSCRAQETRPRVRLKLVLEPHRPCPGYSGKEGYLAVGSADT